MPIKLYYQDWRDKMIEFDVLQFNSDNEWHDLKGNKIRCDLKILIDRKYIPEIFDVSTAGGKVIAKTNPSQRNVDESVLKIIKGLEHEIKRNNKILSEIKKGTWWKKGKEK